MGTRYQVTLEARPSDLSAIETAIQLKLTRINQLMSTYLEDSELSRFNQHSGTDCYALSSETLTVLREAQRLHRVSQGAFDPSLGKLIELWGFDKTNTHNQIPSLKQISDAQAHLAFGRLSLASLCAKKSDPLTQINLSAIAKGFAVDELARLLESRFSIKNYLVEIGGETKTRGINSRAVAWNIAIESPESNTRTVQKIINPGIMAVATSGDYRNYFERDGKRFSHTINPVTGYPITHALASVTVIHPSCMTADGLATAIMVMGPEEGLKLAEREKIAIFMLVKSDSGFKEVMSSDFPQYLKTRQ